MKSWIVYSILALALTSCGGRVGLPCIESSTLGADEAGVTADPFENLQVQVGVDASESMQGFVRRPGTRYSQAIASLHTLLQNKKVPTTYWRVGSNAQVNTAQPISANQFLAASKSDFYCRRGQESPEYPCVSSTLGQIYELKAEAPAGSETENDQSDNENEDRPPTRTLKILLTDLEPNNSAVGQISGLISEELRNNDNYKAVLIGVRSQFQGNVYSADGSYTTFTYNTTGQDVDQKGRPFFVLMTGPQETVDELVREFRRLPLDVNRAFRASSFELGETDTVTLDNSSLTGEIKECVNEIGAINRQRPDGDQARDWLMIQQDDCGENIDDPLPAVELTIPSKNTLALTGGELTPDLFQVSHPVATVKKAEITPNSAGEGSRLLITTVFEGEKLQDSNGELIYITLGDRQLDQAVWKDWDMDIGKPDGAKTQNLLLFVSGLRGAVANDQHAVKFCLGYSR